MRVIGDIHGDFDWYTTNVKSWNVEGINTFQLGDFGIGFPRMEKWNEYWLSDPDGLAEMNRVIVGNHDNPLYAHNSPLFLPKFGNDGNLFWVGGAASIDKDWRIEHVSWWRDEELSYSEMMRCQDLYTGIKPDIMITHDGPLEALMWMFPYEMGNPNIPPSATQRFLQSLFEIHQPKKWIFGHWHITIETEINGCQFYCIEEKGWKDIEL